MTIAIDERVKFRHNWYKVEAVDTRNGYIEAYDVRNMKKVENSEVKKGLIERMRG